MQHEAAQRGEDVQYQRVETAPWLRSQSSSMIVTQAIFGANIAVFLAMALSIGGTMLSGPPWQALLGWGANFGPLTLSGQWWRLLTCLFVHGGLLHIAFNMWCFWDLGQLAESLYGHVTFAAVYLTCGLAASLTSLWWHPLVPSVGASGAIFGIAGALIASFYLGEFSLPRAALGGTLRSLLIFVGFNVFFGVAVVGTDNAAHIGGLAMGLILGALIAKAAPNPEDFPRRIAVLLIGALLVVGGIFWLARSGARLIHDQYGVAPLQGGNNDQAIAELQKAVAQRPDSAPTHAALAQAYFQQHDYPNAAAEMERVIALSPRSERAYYQLGQIYLEQNLPTKAQETFTRLLKINPQSANGHNGLAAAYSAQRRDVEALAEYKRVAELDPDYPMVNYNMGAEQTDLGQYDDAIASLLEQRAAGDNPDTENLLATIYDKKKMQEQAADAKARAAAMSGGK